LSQYHFILQTHIITTSLNGTKQTCNIVIINIYLGTLYIGFFIMKQIELNGNIF